MLSRNQAVQEVLDIYDKLELVDRLNSKSTDTLIVNDKQATLSPIQKFTSNLGKKSMFSDLFRGYRSDDVKYNQDDDTGVIIWEQKYYWACRIMVTQNLPTEFSKDEVINFFEDELTEVYEKSRAKTAAENGMTLAEVTQ